MRDDVRRLPLGRLGTALAVAALVTSFHFLYGSQDNLPQTQSKRMQRTSVGVKSRSKTRETEIREGYVASTTTDVGGDQSVTVTPTSPTTRQTTVPTSETVSCQPWRCTCQGYSDTFGTYPGHWGTASRHLRDVRSWWITHHCDTHPVIGAVVNISGTSPMPRQTTVPTSETVSCQPWLCTCQGYSDTFGTYPGHWEAASRDVRSWWITHHCDTHPGSVTRSTTTIVPNTFAIGIPAMYSELSSVQRAVCSAWQDQTVPPDEVVVAISGVPPDVKLPFINATVVVSVPLRYAGWARNSIADNTHCKWILYHDADDGMYPDRVEITRQALMKWPRVQIMGHTYTKTLVPVAHPKREWKWVSGEDIWHHFGGKIGWSYKWPIHNGHIAVKTDVVRRIRYVDKKKNNEDMEFFWGSVKKLNDSAAVTILNIDLSSYIPRKDQAAALNNPAPTPLMFKSRCD